MKPLPFFVGIFVGLAALSWAGIHVRSKEWTRQFTRFHRLIDPETNYFPTVRQIEQIIDDGPQDKVFVIVGGTSVFYGTGQPDAAMWTRRLQNLLGERFHVLNFAQRGGRSNEFGNIAAEILLQRYARVIYVADGMPNEFSVPYRFAIYKPEIVEAWIRGCLIPWPPRDKMFHLRFNFAPDAFQSVILEEMLNRVFNFNDFWNNFVFQIANLNWTPYLARKMFAPRFQVHDNEEMAEAAHPYPYPNDVESKIARSWIIPQNARSTWAYVRGVTEATIPPELRRVTLVTIHLSSPSYSQSTLGRRACRIHRNSGDACLGIEEGWICGDGGIGHRVHRWRLCRSTTYVSVGRTETCYDACTEDIDLGTIARICTMIMKKIADLGLSFAAGLLVALAIHFMLYRISLPLKPFIYVVF